MGVFIGIEALGSNESGVEIPDAVAIVAGVRYLPRRPKNLDESVRRAQLRCAARWPHRWLREALRSRGRDRRRFLQATMVADRAHREKFEVIHAHFATAAADVARMASAISGIPFTVTAHAKDIFSDEHAPLIAQRLAPAAHVVTVSRFNELHLRAAVPGIEVNVVRNAVELADPHTPSSDGPVLCVARLVEKKGVDTLLAAVAALGHGCPTLRVEIVGDGELLDHLVRLTSDLGISDRVCFLGALSPAEVSAAYRRASMLVLPCRVSADGDRDGLPTVIVEAMAHSLPVISTDIIGIAEVVRNGATGLLVPPDDPKALAAAIESIARNPDMAACFGAAGRRVVAEEFDPETSAMALREVLAAAARGKS